jgi:hypothetical protein
MRYYVFLAVLLSLFVFLVAGCAGKYGKLRLQYGHGEKMTAEILIENWEDYLVYRGGPSRGSPSAVMFDPKNDDRTIVPHRRWAEVKNQEELTDLITWVHGPTGDMSVFPKVMNILGPNDEFFGYMYTQWSNVLMKPVDDKTLWVDEIPLPPTDYGPSLRIR